MIDGLTIENAAERLEATKTKAEKIKADIRAQYENAKALIAKTEESFEKNLAEFETRLIIDEISQINELLKDARTQINVGTFEMVEQFCHEANGLIELLVETAAKRGQQKEVDRERLGIPQGLLDAFQGDLTAALEFMSNVSKIETWRLGSHALTCGRNRARATCEIAWDAMGETSSFFCGADPNDVKYYVYERHFGEGAIPVIRRQEKGSYNNNLSTSTDSMSEALRKAGLL